MSYNKRVGWKDHVVEHPRTYTEITNEDGTKTLTPAPGEIIQQGTPQSAKNFNAMDEAIQHVSIAFDLLQTTSQAEIRGLEKEIEKKTAPDFDFATDEEYEEAINEVISGGSGDWTPISDDDIATDEEVDELLDGIWGE